MAELTTLPRYLLRNAAEMGDRPAIREKDRGIWQTHTWTQYVENVRDFALGLASLGFARGDKLSVIGDNRPRLYWAQAAAQCLGGVSVPVYQDSIAKELAFVWNHASVSVIVAEDQEQVDKILGLKDELRDVKWVIYDDPRGFGHYSFDWLKSFSDVEALGREFAKTHPGYFEAEIARGQPDDVAFICYTSGTTGNPKGAMLSHRNMIATGRSALEAIQIRPGDDWLAYLPMAWVGDSFYTLLLSLVVPFTVNCPESPETVQRDLRELGPHSFLAPPRIWENLLTGVLVRSGDSGRLKRLVFEHFRRVGEKVEVAKAEGKPVSLGMKIQRALGEFFVYGPVRDQLGLLRVRWALTGGAPLGPDTFRFFRAIGVNLKQIYGATETSGLVALHRDDDSDSATNGLPCPGIEVKIGDRGEVLVKSAGIFKGYYKNEDATKQVIGSDGWFHTGDAGFIDPRGHLVIIDRAKDVGALAGGTAFAPQFIENKLKFSPFIREAVAFGNGHPFVTAMVAVDINTVGTWAERRAVPYTSYADLSVKAEIRELIRDEIAKINETLPEATRVRRFLLLTKDLDADDAEMTRTRKVRRSFVAEKYANVIGAFYSGARDVELSSTITYEDGRTAVMRSHVQIEDVRARELAHA
jgi:long-chain acyl-CoA synthetase